PPGGRRPTGTRPTIRARRTRRPRGPRSTSTRAPGRSTRARPRSSATSSPNSCSGCRRNLVPRPDRIRRSARSSMIFRSPYPDVTVPAVGLAEFLLGGLTPGDAERLAAVDAATGESYRYDELVDSVGRIAGALAARGIGRGDVAAL